MSHDYGTTDEYERKTDQDIRRLKNRLKLLREARKLAAARAAKRKDEGVRRAIFGGKDFFKKKDTTDIPVGEWKREFDLRRHHSMMLPGRHTSRYGNFLVHYNTLDSTLSVRCMDGKTAVLHGFHLSRFHREFLSLFGRDPRERESIGYNFILHEDRDGRRYFTVSVTLTLSHDHQNTGFDSGCVSIDLNVDRIAVCDIDSDGTLLEHLVIPFCLDGKTSGQAACIIGNAMAEVGTYCADRKKCLVMEDLDFIASKRGMRYGNKVHNRAMSAFVYRKLMACAASQGYKHGFTVYTVNPAYTSAAGKLLYMRKFGCQVHEAAAYVIGLSGMGMFDKCAVPDWMEALLPRRKKSAAEKDSAEDKPKAAGEDKPSAKERHHVDKIPVIVKLDNSLYNVHGKKWRSVMTYMQGVPHHAYYRKVDEDDWNTARKHTAKKYFAILKEKSLKKPILPKRRKAA